MTASPVTRLVGLFGLFGLGPIVTAMALGSRSLPETALAASAWFAAVLALSWLLRWVLESAAVSAERRVATTPRRRSDGVAGTAQHETAGEGATGR